MSYQYHELLGGDSTEKEKKPATRPEEEEKDAKPGTAYYRPAVQLSPSEDREYRPFADFMTAAPEYKSRYAAELDRLYGDILGREPFSYSASADPLYQQYRERYTADGELAMRDSMGYAAGLTGGYGSSYAQSVGQQQYGEYMRELNEYLPELYKQAYDAYQDDGDWLVKQYGLLGEREQSDYDRYRDAVSDWEDERNFELKLRDMEYDRLLFMMQNSRYMPGDKQLAAAGISRKQAEELYKSLHG